MIRAAGAILPWAALLAVLPACGSGTADDDPVIARAFDRSLHWSDLRQIIPIGTAAEDSAAMAQAYIGTWLRQQVELHQAELNLSPEQKSFENELEDYRNSLVLYAYEEELVTQRLDTAISAADIEAYYQAHASDFDLPDDILRVRWFKVPEDDKRAVKRMEERFLSGDAERMREVEIALVERGITITDRTALWTALADLRNEVPVEALPAMGPEGRRLVIRHEGAAWFLDILELRARQSPAPIELVRQDIRTILLNQRKLDLIGKMREDLFHEAIANKSVEQY